MNTEQQSKKTVLSPKGLVRTASRLALGLALGLVASVAQAGPGNTPPTITAIPDQVTNEGVATGAILFYVGDAETAATGLTLSATTDNPALVLPSHITFGGTGAARRVRVAPNAYRSGTARVRVTVTDGGGLKNSQVFTVTVNAVNNPPILSTIPDQVITINTSSAPIPFIIRDAETASDSLTLKVTTDNPWLILPSHFVLGGSGINRTLTITPNILRSGTAHVRVTVTDPEGALCTKLFNVTVNHLPTITAIANQSIAQDASSAAIPFTIDDADSGAGSVALKATTSNPALIPAANVVFAGTGTSRTATITPAAGQSGTCNVRVTVTDPVGGKASRLFTVTVAAGPSYDVLSFNDGSLTYTLAPFGGDASVLTNTGVPAGGPINQVVQINKTAGSATWAGTTMYVGYLESIATVPFSLTNTKMKVVFYSPAAGVDVKLKVEDAENNTHTVETDVIAAAGWQTLTFDFANPAPSTPALNLSYTFNKISIFSDFGTTPGADAIYYVGPITFLGANGPAAPPLVQPVVSAPTTAPTAPALPQGSVISLLSKVYTNVPVDTWATAWSNATYTPVTIAGDDMKEYGPLAYVGIEFTGANMIDASAMTYFHVDAWTPDMTNFQVKLVDFGADGAYGGGDDSEGLFTGTAASTPALTGTGQWVSFDIPYTAFAGTFNKAHLAQLLFVSGTGVGTVYVDNIYFH